MSIEKNRAQYYKQQPANFRICPSCGKQNPRSAYCCLSCFKVMGKQIETPFWKIQVTPSISVAVILCALVVSGILYVKNWIRAVEAQVDGELQAVAFDTTIKRAHIEQQQDFEEQKRASAD